MGCASLIDLDYLGYLKVAYWLNIYKLNIFKYKPTDYIFIIAKTMHLILVHTILEF